ncbi:CBS domain-containing protein [Flocculibacter collagenilyticus]|uniref:CBS domain-containing protein n=1 Tax=Flocculibacter collagenilyticus TaxID=2744479 RepID=UPI0018F3953A|nr:CBS domain-containing protein [Flocculibacter collagenilyticus]
MESVKVSEYMQHHPVTFTPDMTVVAAVEKLLETHQIGGPVIDDKKHVIGFLSEQDCLKQMLDATYQNESHSTVNEVMRKDVITVSPHSGIFELAQDMTGLKPKIYPVVNEDGILLGTITRINVLKALDMHLHSIYEQGHRFV